MDVCVRSLFDLSRKENHMKKRWNRIKTFLSKPYNVLLVLFLVVLTFLVVIPLISIVGDTFLCIPRKNQE